MNHDSEMWPAMIPLALFVAIISGFLYRRYAGLSLKASVLAWFGALIIVAWIAVPRIRAIQSVHDQFLLGAAWDILCAGCFCWLAGPFIVRLWGKWFDNRMTDAEREPGPASWRAWLGGRHVVYAIILAVLASRGWDFSLVLGILLFLGALAAYPAILIAGQMPSSSSASNPSRPISAEREKVMDLLSAGKITAEESAQLLNALGSTASAEAVRPAPMSSRQRLALIGAGLIVIGFFLPWFVINVGRDLQSAMSQFTANFSQIENSLPGTSGSDARSMINLMPANALGVGNNLTARISGGDIPHGLGWVILLLGVAAAAAPFAIRGVDEATLHTIRLGALGVGSFILLYLLSESIRYVSFGIVFAIVGYALEWISILRHSRPALAAQPA